MEYKIENLTKEEAKYIGEKINEIVPREMDADKGETGFVEALFVEEPLRFHGPDTYLLREAEEFAKENGASVFLTSAGDRNVDFFQKNGYLLDYKNKL